jgi:hypothetical protein
MRIILLVIAVASMLWSLGIWLAGGFRMPLGSLSIASTDPLRPLAAAAVAAIAYAMVSGTAQVRRDLSELSHFSVPLAVLLSLCPAVAGLANNSWTAAGSDSYAYVAQADLWLRGTQTVPVPIADVVPWPNAVWSFTPYGFRPASSGSALVPMTAPGLSLMMAAAKALAGHCAMFWIVPVTGALLVWMTFLIGRRLHSDGVGLAAAWLMATSPAFLAMLVSPMSDVPAAAFWAVAIYFTFDGSNRGAVAAGMAASVAILIRPNLAPLAAVLLLSRITPLRRSAYFLGGVLPGCLLVAWVNRSVYGSPFSSGYGNLSSLFSLANVPVNLLRYGGWFIQSQTPIALVGFVALFFYSRQSRLLAAFVVAVIALYLAYVPFDAWWYLRFLLPAWPAICVGTAALLLRRVTFWSLGIVILMALGIHGIVFAATHGAFPTGEGDHRYATIGKLVEQFTDPSSVILAGQNSGPTRYYGSRITMRFDQLDAAWLDRSVAWLSEHGRRPYFLLEEWELPLFQQRFAGNNTLGALALTPVLAYRSPGVPGRVYLFDPARPDGPTRSVIAPPSARPKCVEPAAPVMLNLR